MSHTDYETTHDRLLKVEAERDALAAELASEKQQLDNALSFYPARIRELEARDHCPCEDCKRARASESETK